jgi:hypothetical protein
MVRSWVFTLKKVRSTENAFNKKMTRKPPLSDTTFKVEPRVLTPEIETRSSTSTAKNKVHQGHYHLSSTLLKNTEMGRQMITVYII